MRFPLGKVLRAILPSIIPALVDKIAGRSSSPAAPDIAPRIELPLQRPQTQPNAAGVTTSEYRNTRLVQLVSAAVLILAAFFPDAPVDSIRDTLLWLAGFALVGSQAAYVAGRASVKGSLARAAASQYAAHVAQELTARGVDPASVQAAMRAPAPADPAAVRTRTHPKGPGPGVSATAKR